jgi:hypothetical protein
MNAQSAGTGHGAIWVAGVFLLLIGLFLPALVNRQPVMYSDSVGYFHSGHAAMKQAEASLDARTGGAVARPPAPALTREQADGVTTARSVYYGLVYVASYVAAGVWGLAAVQVLLTLGCLILAARRVVRLDLVPWFVALGGIVLLTGLDFFAVTAMPDLFAGLMLLGMGMILAYGPVLPRWEYAVWLALVTVACLFHKAHLAILALSLAAAAAVLPVVWRQHGRDLLLLAGAGAVALAGHFAVDLTVRQVTGKFPIPVPFLLARLVGDGTAQRYLQDVCPSRHFTTCDYLGKMPMTENDFLWSREADKSVMGDASRQTRAAIADEAGVIVWGTLKAYPLEEAAAAARNVMVQLGDVGVGEFALVPSDPVAPVPILRPALDQYRMSAIAEGWMPLTEISVLMRGVYFAALVGIGTLLWRRPRGPAQGDPDVRFVLLLLTGIAANAVVSGAIAGVFDRYQGRVAWLASLGFAVLLAKMLKARRRASDVLKAR